MKLTNHIAMVKVTTERAIYFKTFYTFASVWQRFIFGKVSHVFALERHESTRFFCFVTVTMRRALMFDNSNFYAKESKSILCLVPVGIVTSPRLHAPKAFFRVIIFRTHSNNKIQFNINKKQ